MSESPEWCDWAAQRIKELEVEVERQTTECIKRGFEVESLMTELSSLKLMVESYRAKLAKLVEWIDRGWDHNIPMDEARQALGEKE